MPNLLDTAVDKIVEGVLDSQCHNFALGLAKQGVLDPKDVPAMAVGLKLLIGATVATVAKGQG